MLKLMYITNRPEIAEIVENAGVERIFIDMEYIGNALEIYGSILFELYTRPELEKIVKGMCQSE